MTKKEMLVQRVSSSIQQAIVLDLAANVTDSTKRLIAAELSLLYEAGMAEGESNGFMRAAEIAKDVVSRAKEG